MRSIISEQLGTELDKVAPDAKFVDLGADSLDTVEIMMALEEQFDITLDEARARPGTWLLAFNGAARLGFPRSSAPASLGGEVVCPPAGFRCSRCLLCDWFHPFGPALALCRSAGGRREDRHRAGGRRPHLHPGRQQEGEGRSRGGRGRESFMRLNPGPLLFLSSLS